MKKNNDLKNTCEVEALPQQVEHVLGSGDVGQIVSYPDTFHVVIGSLDLYIKGKIP